MKYFSWAVFFILWLPLSSHAARCPEDISKREEPCTPSLEERRLIEDAIARGLAARERFVAARDKEQELRNENPSSMEELQAWQEANAVRELSEKKMREQFNQIIELTSRSYGVVPKVASGEIQGDLLPGLSVFWSPRIEHEGTYLQTMKSDGTEYMKPDGKPYIKRFDPDYLRRRKAYGVAWPDGSTVIPLETLEKAKSNPGFLAYALYHESIHFHQFVKEGVRTIESSEYDAYDQSLKKASIFNLIRLEIADFRAIQTENKKIDDAGKGTPPSIDADSQLVYQRDWGQIRRGLIEVDRKRAALRIQMEESRRESLRREREAARRRSSENANGAVRVEIPASGAVRAEVPGPAQAAGPYGPAYADSLADLAQRSCAGPGSIPQSELDSRFSWYPHPIVREAAQDGRGLTGCSKELYLLFLKWNDEPGTGRMMEPWLTELSRSISAKYASSPATSAPDPSSSSPDPDLPDAPAERGDCFQGGEFRWCPKK